MTGKEYVNQLADKFESETVRKPKEPYTEWKLRTAYELVGALKHEVARLYDGQK